MLGRPSLTEGESCALESSIWGSSGALRRQTLGVAEPAKTSEGPVRNDYESDDVLDHSLGRI
jgi:hypothetical protein